MVVFSPEIVGRLGSVQSEEKTKGARPARKAVPFVRLQLNFPPPVHTLTRRTSCALIGRSYQPLDEWRFILKNAEANSFAVGNSTTKAATRQAASGKTAAPLPTTDSTMRRLDPKISSSSIYTSLVISDFPKIAGPRFSALPG